MKGWMTFLGGALVGAAVAALVTPESGADLRARIRTLLRKRGWLPLCQVEEDEYVEMIAARIEDDYE